MAEQEIDLTQAKEEKQRQECRRKEWSWEGVDKKRGQDKTSNEGRRQFQWHGEKCLFFKLVVMGRRRCVWEAGREGGKAAAAATVAASAGPRRDLVLFYSLSTFKKTEKKKGKRIIK